MKKLIYKYIEDMLIVGGMLMITVATFLLSKIAALYVLGFFLFALGCHFSKFPPNDNERRR